MRLWHKDLIPVLPKQQLLGQWRECCAIAKNIKMNGTPNHLLVNKVMDYPITHFYAYGLKVASAMMVRNYKFDFEKFDQYFKPFVVVTIPHDELFTGWHNDRYFMQCYANLEEKHDCGGIPDDEWRKVYCLMEKKIIDNMIASAKEQNNRDFEMFAERMRKNG